MLCSGFLRSLLLLAIVATKTSADVPASPPPPAPGIPLPASTPSHPAELRPPPKKVSNITIEENGWTFGNFVVKNNCPIPLYGRSVGAWYLNGPRNESWGTPENEFFVEIPPKSTYVEPFRASGGCPNQNVTNSTGQVNLQPVYCPQEDKLGGQGISFKISKTKVPADPDLTQIEYALYKNPEKKNDTFKRLYYDFSLLDCVHEQAGTADLTGTDAQHKIKVQRCPGYEGGVAVTFSGDPDHSNCPLIYCDGSRKCMQIYTWDRSRDQEASFTCEREYRGNMTVELCVSQGENNETIKSVFEPWAKKATHEVFRLDSTMSRDIGNTATGNVAPLAPSAPANGNAASSVSNAAAAPLPPTGVPNKPSPNSAAAPVSNAPSPSNSPIGNTPPANPPSPAPPPVTSNAPGLGDTSNPVDNLTGTITGSFVAAQSRRLMRKDNEKQVATESLPSVSTLSNQQETKKRQEERPSTTSVKEPEPNSLLYTYPCPKALSAMNDLAISEYDPSTLNTLVASLGSVSPREPRDEIAKTGLSKPGYNEIANPPILHVSKNGETTTPAAPQAREVTKLVTTTVYSRRE